MSLSSIENIKNYQDLTPRMDKEIKRLMDEQEKLSRQVAKGLMDIHTGKTKIRIRK